MAVVVTAAAAIDCCLEGAPGLRAETGALFFTRIVRHKNSLSGFYASPPAGQP